MAITEKDLIQGNYYIHPNHGICSFDKIQFIENKKYYSFTFNNAETLYVPQEQLDIIIEHLGQGRALSKLGDRNWKFNYDKYLIDTEILTIRKKAISQIEAYKNILIDGLETNNILLTQYSNENYNDDRELNDFIESILQNSSYPEGYNKNIEVEYSANSKIAIINYRIPNTDEVPKIIRYKRGDLTLDKFIEINMKEKDFAKYYESIVFQITLRSINEIFNITENNILETIVFNGWVDAINKKTGADFTSCIISVMVSRIQSEKINLNKITLKDCILYLKGIFAGELIHLSPVKPILDINKNDKRFVDSKDVLSEINEGVNLAAMDWQDFEYLIRELFEKIFSTDGSEVKVTQASRDGGVDAVAFDNDPVKGGKFIIQAKRYNNIVPVSATRDLYGTVINEGAIKGILVTTSYFGNDSREFAKDKPITLIDGSNLMYLLNEYGYKAYIKLKENKFN